MPLIKTGEIVQAHDFAFPEDAIFCAKKIASEMLDSGANDARVLLNLDDIFVEVTPYSSGDGLLDAWRRAYVLGECKYTLPSGVYLTTPLVVEPRDLAEPLKYNPPAGASRSELAKWRRAFLSELYIELRDNADPSAAPRTGWPIPGSFEPGRLAPPPEEAEDRGDKVEILYHFIVFWTKLVQKRLNEGASFEEAALEGVQRTHLLEVSRHEARVILRLISLHLSKVWAHAQLLYDWYSNWMDSVFPQEVPPEIPDWLR